jgi:hypothetical protein
MTKMDFVNIFTGPVCEQSVLSICCALIDTNKRIAENTLGWSTKSSVHEEGSG